MNVRPRVVYLGDVVDRLRPSVQHVLRAHADLIAFDKFDPHEAGSRFTWWRRLLRSPRPKAPTGLLCFAGQLEGYATVISQRFGDVHDQLDAAIALARGEHARSSTDIDVTIIHVGRDVDAYWSDRAVVIGLQKLSPPDVEPASSKIANTLTKSLEDTAVASAVAEEPSAWPSDEVEALERTVYEQRLRERERIAALLEERDSTELRQDLAALDEELRDRAFLLRATR
jgi:hypothetical protein